MKLNGKFLRQILVVDHNLQRKFAAIESLAAAEERMMSDRQINRRPQLRTSPALSLLRNTGKILALDFRVDHREVRVHFGGISTRETFSLQLAITDVLVQTCASF